MNDTSGCFFRRLDSRRKRQRTGAQSTILILTLALCWSTTSAFLSPTAQVGWIRKIPTCHVTIRNDASPVTHPGEDEGDDDQSSGWLSWMAQGRRKGVSEVKMRDPEELGGVPRSDRYSSR